MRYFIIFQYILVQVAFLIPNSCLSQKYFPMNFSEGFWVEKYDLKGGYTEEIQKFCNGDTSIDNQLYHKLYETKIVYSPPGFIPDTSIGTYLGLIGNFPEKIIKYIPKGKDEPTSIYDFNLDIGDTIHGALDIFVINEIDSIEICGRYHKRYIEILEPNHLARTLVEGVGYTNGLLGYYDVFDQGGETVKSLVCYSEWDNLECSSCNYIIGVPTRDLYFQVYPNPVLNELIVQSSKPIIFIHVYDLIGSKLLIQNSEFEYSKVLNLNHLDPGYYILRVQFTDYSSHSLTIVKN